MIDRFFTLALALGFLALAVSTAVGVSPNAASVNPRLVEFDRVMINAPRTMFAGATTPEFRR